MQVYNCCGALLHHKLFIEVYGIARKMSPARFLTLRLHPDKYVELFKLADIPESIQLGPAPGRLGKQIIRVACIKPPMGVSDGMTVLQDDKVSPNKLVFEIHGIPELVVENLQ